MSATSTMTAAGPIALDVPFADVTAADLRLSIGGAVPPKQKIQQIKDRNDLL